MTMDHGTIFLPKDSAVAVVGLIWGELGGAVRFQVKVVSSVDVCYNCPHLCISRCPGIRSHRLSEPCSTRLS